MLSISSTLSLDIDDDSIFAFVFNDDDNVFVNEASIIFLVFFIVVVIAGAGNSVIINNIIRSRMIRISDVGDVRWGESLALAFRCREFDSSLRHRQSISTSSRDGGRQRDSLPRFEAAYRRKVSSMAHRHRVSPMTPGHDTYLLPCQDVT